MTTTIRRRGLAILLGLALAFLALPAGAAPQDSPPPKNGGGAPPPPEKTPEEKRAEEVKAFLKHYEENLSKMADAEAIEGLKKLRVYYVDPKVEPDLRKGVLKLFQTKVIRVRGKDAYLEAATKTLGEMGGEDVVPVLKYLVEYGYGVKGFIVAVVRGGLASLGKIASAKPADVKYLTDQLKGKEGSEEFIGDVAKALAGYEKAPGAVRREIFEELLKISEGVYSKSQNNDANGKKSWNIWGAEVVEAMQKVTRQKFATPPEFRKWFNNKAEGGGKNPRTWADNGESKEQKN